MQKQLIPALALILVCNIFIFQACPAQEIRWYPDLQSASKAASKQNKLLLLHFTADWCRPCNTLETFVFKSPDVQRKFGENVVAVKIDVDANSHLVQEYGVSGVPYDVAVTPTGRVVSKRKSPKDSTGYGKMLDEFGKITNDLVNGQSPALAQNLAELQELMENKNPTFEGQPTSFTPDAPSYDAPLPSRESADLKRKSQVVGNPYIQTATPEMTAQNTFQPEQKLNAPAVLAPPQHPKSRTIQNLKFQQTNVPESVQSQAQAQAQPPASVQSQLSVTKKNEFVPVAVPGQPQTQAPVSVQVQPQPPASLQSQLSVTTNNEFFPVAVPGQPQTQAPVSVQVQPQPPASLQSQLSVTKNNEFVPAVENQFTAKAQTVPPRNIALQRLDQSEVAAKLIREKAQRKVTAFQADPKVIMDDKFNGSVLPKTGTGLQDGKNYQAKIKVPDDNSFLPPEPSESGGNVKAEFVGNQYAGPRDRLKAFNVSNSTNLRKPVTPDPINVGLDMASKTPAKPRNALHGKCPVTLLEQSKWVDGDPQWGCVHRNRIYIFSSEENLKLFQSDPDAHSPILAGYDPVVFHESGRLVDGLEKHGVFMGNVPDQRIVLFADAQTRARFQLEPRKYLEAVRQAMQSTGGSSSELIR